MRYVTNLQITAENVDALMYQFQKLSYDRTSVAMEDTIKSDKGRTWRCVAYKATTIIKDMKYVVENILLLMDMAMIVGIVLQPSILKSLLGEETRPN